MQTGDDAARVETRQLVVAFLVVAIGSCSVGTSSDEPTIHSSARVFAFRQLQAHLFHEHLKILPHFSLCVGPSKQIRGVICDDRGDALVVIPFAACPAHR